MRKWKAQLRSTPPIGAGKLMGEAWIPSDISRSRAGTLRVSPYGRQKGHERDRHRWDNGAACLRRDKTTRSENSAFVRTSRQGSRQLAGTCSVNLMVPGRGAGSRHRPKSNGPVALRGEPASTHESSTMPAHLLIGPLAWRETDGLAALRAEPGDKRRGNGACYDNDTGKRRKRRPRLENESGN